MAVVVLICAGLLGFTPPDQSEYQAAAARAGRDAGAHLKLAVWCEAHDMNAERLKHLATALAIDPQNAAARGLMGLVGYGGKWLPPEKVGETVKADEAMAAKLAEYEGRRRATSDTANGQWRLGLWCEKNGLKAEAMAHFTAVTQIDPKRADAWHKLGCEFSNGRWINAEQAAAERAETRAQWKADMHWERFLMRWKNDLMHDGPRRERAVAMLDGVTDPRAVPSIHKVLARGNRVQQEMAALMLSRIQCPASSHALAGLAMFESWPKGRSFAIQELKRRDPREYMDEMISWMHRPYVYHVTPVGANGEPGRMVIDGDHTQMHRVYQVPATPTPAQPRAADRFPAAVSGMTAFGPAVPAPMNPFPPMGPAAQFREIGRLNVMADAMRPPVDALGAAARNTTQRTLKRDIAVVESFNARLSANNLKVATTLAEITGESLGDDPVAWLKWWNEKLGLRVEPTEDRYKTTTTQYVAIPFRVHHACFAAGTPVPTLTGSRPIESLVAGDMVLSQDTVSGVLSYQPVLGIHHNPPAETVKLRVKDETIICTPVHRFWRPGRGWAMARDLNPGEFVRTATGRAEVVEIKADVVQLVFNLDVARNHSFFVGSGKYLVRDNSLPPLTFTPFDAEPALAEIADDPTGSAEDRHDVLAPSQKGEGASGSGSIWDSAAASSPRSRAMHPAGHLDEPGSIWATGGSSSAPPRSSLLGPRSVGPATRSPR